MNNLIKKAIGVFKNSKRLHLRQVVFNDPTKVVLLIDRFIDGSLNYPLEWDDFISWPNQNTSLEDIRVQIASLEKLAFSANADDRKVFVRNLIVQRNKLAALLGLKLRDY